MFTPQNEQGVIVLFASMIHQVGWKFIEVGTLYPDVILLINDEVWSVEFEFYASNFLDHKHDHRNCDAIVCWINDYPDSSLPIIELRSTDWMNQTYTKTEPYEKEIEYWKRRCLNAEAIAKRFEDSQKRKEISSRDLANMSLEEKKEHLVSVLKSTPDINRTRLAEQLAIGRTTLYAWIEELQTEATQ